MDLPPLSPQLRTKYLKTDLWIFAHKHILDGISVWPSPNSILVLFESYCLFRKKQTFFNFFTYLLH